MLRLRAKAKVRYAVLLCIITIVGIYLFLRISNPGTANKLLDGGSHIRKIESDFSRRSFTAKWHDGRGLLNDISDTKRSKNIRAKFEKHLADRRALEGEVRAGNIAVEKEHINHDVDLTRNDQIQNEVSDNVDEYIQEEATDRLLTTAASYESHVIESERNERRFPTPEIQSKRMNENHRRKGSIPKKQPDHTKENDRYLVPDMNLKGKDNKNHSRDVKNDVKDVTRRQTLQNVGKKPSPTNGPASNDVISDVKESNRTIFDPADHEITYILLKDKNFVKSLFDESRKFDTFWAPGFPITPHEAIMKYGDRLPSWERFEIMHYPKIFYLGLGANKTQLTSNATENFGYDYFHEDEEEGHYRIVVGDHIAYRFEIIKFLGSGTFGAVVLARDWSQPAARNVALKIMHYDENDKYIIRELNMMKAIEGNATNKEYFSRMLATFNFRNHKCMVLELLGDSLHRHKHGPVKDLSLFRRFAHDILMGLHYLKELNVVHADMKPGNIMYMYGKSNTSEGQLLKVADFGIGCVPGDKHLFKCPSYYVQTRYYRAPEVILSLGITPAVDMFSVGVIFSEFYLGSPPFFGETETDHFASMMEVLGLPPTHMIAKSPRKKVYQRAICYETESGFKRRPYRKPLTKVLHGMDSELFDLIARCLEFDPKLRITPEEALKHPFVTGIQPDNELKTPISMQRFLGKI